MKVKICFLVSSLSNEGPVNVMYNIIRLINYNVFDVSVVTLVPEKVSSRLSEFCAFPITIKNISGTFSGRILRPFKMFKALKTVVSDLKPDILHSHCPRSLFLMYFLSGKYKKAYTVHVYPGLQQKVLYGAFVGAVVVALSKFFIKRIDLPVACAENVAKEFLAKDKLDVLAIPNGGAFSVSSITRQQKLELRAKLGLEIDVKYFIFVGRLSKEKNPLFLIERFYESGDLNIGLIMLGEGNLFGEIKEKSFANLVLPGFVKNVKEYLQAADYYVSSSIIEGLANSLLEAMALGLPVLLSDIPPHLEVVNKSSKKIGFVFKNNNVNEFYEKIALLLHEDETELKENVQDCYSNFFTAEKMTKNYEDAYLTVLKN